MARLQEYVEEVPEKRRNLQETDTQQVILRLAAERPDITPAQATRELAEEGIDVDNSTVIYTLRHATEDLVQKYAPESSATSSSREDGAGEYHVHFHISTTEPKEALQGIFKEFSEEEIIEHLFSPDSSIEELEDLEDFDETEEGDNTDDDSDEGGETVQKTRN